MTSKTKESDRLDELKEACIYVQSSSNTFGSAYLIARNLAATCEHVVRPVGLGGTVELIFPWGSIPATVVRIATEVDVAILRLREPVVTRPLRLGTEKVSGAAWVAHGFPAVAQHAQEPVGVMIGGQVADANAKDDLGRPALQLFSNQSDWPEGLSGSPVVVDGVVVGHLTRKLAGPSTKEGVLNVLYACPISYVEALARELFDAARSQREPEPPGLPYNSETYIHRGREERRAIRFFQYGAPVVIAGPELFGKSAFLGYLLEQLHEMSRRDGTEMLIVKVNLASFVASSSKTRRLDGNALFDWLDAALVRSLSVTFNQNPNNQITSFLTWSEKLTSHVKECLDRIFPAKLLFAIEHASSLQRLPDLRDTFYALLREWSARVREAPWSRLWLILEISTTTALFSQGAEASISPFSTPPVEIGDFGEAQAIELARYHELDWKKEDFGQLMNYVGGHPYLLRLAMYEARQEKLPIDIVLRDAENAQGIFDRYLSNLFWSIIKDENIIGALRKILAHPGAHVGDLMAAERLSAAGIVKHTKNGYQIRYKLYEVYLRRKLGSE